MDRYCARCREPLPESFTDGSCPSCGFAFTADEPTARGFATEHEPEVEFECGPVRPSSDREVPATIRQEPEFHRTRPYFPDIPNYTDFEVLGHGGMGTVYRAIQRPTNRVVAIKVMNHFAPDSPMRERFANEVRAHAFIDHPGVVAIYEVGDCSHGPYFTMEYRPGSTLGALIKNGRLDIRTAVRILADSAEAIHAAHCAGILHRDIKPSNILVDHDGRVRVTDFGLARHADGDSLTAHGVHVGTYTYMSPEQLAGDPTRITPASDLFCLGSTLFHALAGRTIRPLSPNGQVMPHDWFRNPPRLGSLRPEICPILESIVAKCLAIEPGDRYDTAEQLARDLRNWLESKPTLARPPSRIQRIRRRLHDHRAALLALLAIVVALPLTGAAIQRRDPKHQLEARLEAAVSTRTPLVIVPNLGAPLWSETKLGSVDFQSPPVRNGTFGFRADHPTLISLVERPPTPSYRFEADLLYHGESGPADPDTLNGRSGVGLFLDYQSLQLEDGRCAHSSLTFPIRDGGDPRKPKALNAHLYGIVEDTVHLYPTSCVMLLPPKCRLAQSRDGMPNWRTVGLTVNENSVELEYREGNSEWLHVAMITPSSLLVNYRELRRALSKITRSTTGFPLDFDSQRPIGIYARHAAVSIRNVMIQPLSPP